MPQQQNTLSPSLFAVLLQQAAQGTVKAANLVANVQANLPISFREHSAMFVKDKPGAYEVVLYQNGQEIGRTACSSPVEAKLEVLDYLIRMAREAQAPVPPPPQN